MVEMEKPVSQPFVSSLALGLETCLISVFPQNFQEHFTFPNSSFTQSIPSLPPTFLGTAVLILFFSFFAIGRYLYITNWTRQARLLKQFNGGIVLPFFGNSYEFFGSPWKTQVRLSNYHAKHGKIAKFWFTNSPNVFTSCSKLAEKVLSSRTEHLEKASVYKAIHDFGDAGLVTSNGEVWKNDRRVLNNGFSKPMLNCFLETFNKECKILTEQLSEIICKDQACKSLNKKPKPHNFYPHIFTAVMEIILVLGEGLNLQNEGQDHRFAKAMKIFDKGLHDRIYKPFLFNIPLVYRLMARLAEERKANDIFMEPCLAARERKIKEMKKESCSGGDLSEIRMGRSKAKPVLDILMEQTPQPSAAVYRDHLLTFLGAGSDTTSTSVYQTLFFLALNPEIQKKCHEEVDFILGGEKDPSEVTQGQIAETAYVERCWKESMRLRPPVPVFGRNLTADLVIDDGRVLPKGTGVLFNIFDMHRDPELYENPLLFDPDRFLPENVAKRKVQSYLPFSYGIRNCIGFKYAQLEAMVFLIHILARFKLSTVQRMEDIKIAFGIVGKPSPEIEIAFELR